LKKRPAVCVASAGIEKRESAMKAPAVHLAVSLSINARGLRRLIRAVISGPLAPEPTNRDYKRSSVSARPTIGQLIAAMKAST
jgi:hypothetical protein